MSLYIPVHDLDRMTDAELLEELASTRNRAERLRIAKVIKHRESARAQIQELDRKARPLALKRGLSPKAETLCVLVERFQHSQGNWCVHFKCPACGHGHIHGAHADMVEHGYRVAHCTAEWSPYRRGSYFLVEEVQ
jgi:hypothetical protein